LHSTGYREATGVNSMDGSTSFEITPNPVDYGWGLFHYSAQRHTENLSGFATGA
jgi:hypothetical protein